MPVWDPAASGVWRLEVCGAVRRPLSLTLDDLMKLPRVTQKVDHFCVEGWTARATWTGVRVSDLARAAAVHRRRAVRRLPGFDDDYHESWDIESAMHPQTLVVYGMDGYLLAPGARRAGARALAREARLQEHEVPDADRVHAGANGGYWSDQGYEWYGGT